MQWVLKDISCQVADRILLNNLSTQFDFASPLAVVGASGAGKSIGLQCALGLFPFQKGAVTFIDDDLQMELTEKSAPDQWATLRSNLMFVPQFPNLFDDFTIEENLVFPYRQRKQAQSVLQSEYFTETVTDLGLPAVLHSLPTSLTPGQRKQVAIARAILQRPQALVLDEPTADLDPDAKKQMVAVLKRIREKQIALLVITHDVPLLQELQAHLKVVHQGQFVWEGGWNQRENAPVDVQNMLMV